jgi:predicted  nucleic acid-binding Zn-ribbon protein
MIQAILLIALGFLSASLIGVLVAPSLWSRAYRLSRKRLEQTLPITLSEIEATQDQLRASYAVRMRRLETSLASAKQKAAMQLVDNSRLQMQIVALKDQIADLDLKLSERRNAATVLEQTITNRFPELDREITSVKAQLQERSYELMDLNNKLSRRNDELDAAERAAASYQDELARLQQALEKNSADRTGRRFRRASQWTLEDYRSEYDRLNLELSRLRQQLSHLQNRDAQQAGIIKEELQKLAELILVSAQPKTETRTLERSEPAAAKRPAGPEMRRDRPVPWPEAAPSAGAARKDAGADLGAPPQEPAKPGDGKGEPANLALAAVLSALPDAVLKPQAGNGSVEPADEPQAAASAPRSKLLREAVPAMLKEAKLGDATKNVGSGLKEAGASKNGAGAGAQEAAAGGAETQPGLAALQSGSTLEKAGEVSPGAAERASSPEPAAADAAGSDASVQVRKEAGPAQADRSSAAQSLTLLERLRGVAEETVEPGE